MNDPRKNAPPRTSDLFGEARLNVLYARAEASRQHFMATRAISRPSLFSRLFRSHPHAR